MIEINKIYNDDCLNILKQLPDKSIDLLLTDPPYGGGARITALKLTTEDLAEKEVFLKNTECNERAEHGSQSIKPSLRCTEAVSPAEHTRIIAVAI